MSEFGEMLQEMYLMIADVFNEERGWLAWAIAIAIILLFIAAIWLCLEYVF